MKIIKSNSVIGITATSANAAFPVTNLLDESPKKKWMAASNSVNTATITINTSGKTGAIGLVGITATDAEISISDPNGITWSNVTWNNVTWAVVPNAVNVTQSWQNEGDDFATLWIDFEQFESSVVITIALYKTVTNANTLAAGVLVVGEVVEYPAVLYGSLTEGFIDYSFLRELSNGAYYYKKRNIVRTFNGRHMMNRTDELINFVNGLVRLYGQSPMMIRLAKSPGEWVVYGRLQAMPSINHLHVTKSEINISIIEVL